MKDLHTWADKLEMEEIQTSLCNIISDTRVVNDFDVIDIPFKK